MILREICDISFYNIFLNMTKHSVTEGREIMLLLSKNNRKVTYFTS